MENSGSTAYYEGCLTFPNNMCVIFYDVHKHICIKCNVDAMQGVQKLWKLQILGRSSNFSSTPQCVWLHDTVI